LLRWEKTPYAIGWVDNGIGTKGKWGFVVSLEKVWEIAIQVSLINRPLSQRSLNLGYIRVQHFFSQCGLDGYQKMQNF
jgi:hypothetical protein